MVCQVLLQLLSIIHRDKLRTQDCKIYIQFSAIRCSSTICLIWLTVESILTLRIIWSWTRTNASTEVIIASLDLIMEITHQDNAAGSFQRRDRLNFIMKRNLFAVFLNFFLTRKRFYIVRQRSSAVSEKFDLLELVLTDKWRVCRSLSLF